MDRADIATIAVSAEGSHSRCPFHKSTEAFEEWVNAGLYCSAGKREFKLGRYQVSRFRTGSEYRDALEHFRREVTDYRKTGLLAIFLHDEALCRSSEEELWLLGKAMQDGGLTDDAAALIRGETLPTAVELICPVTGEETIYEFFSVAFSRHAASPSDPLYDPSLSAPFTAVNTTSDAFAFAMLVRDQSIRAFGKAPHEIGDKAAIDLLFRKCVTIWQNMSINTITSYSRLAADPSRGVHLSEDRKRWIAPHNDPVFAELAKCPHVHEMPIVYAARLCAKWSANLFDGKEYVPGRDGQAGGVPVLALEGALDELHEF